MCNYETRNGEPRNCGVLKSTFDFILRSRAIINKNILSVRLDSGIHATKSAYFSYTQFDYREYLLDFTLSLSILSCDRINHHF